jgi:hypothetical protein
LHIKITTKWRPNLLKKDVLKWFFLVSKRFFFLRVHKRFEYRRIEDHGGTPFIEVVEELID